MTGIYLTFVVIALSSAILFLAYRQGKSAERSKNMEGINDAAIEAKKRREDAANVSRVSKLEWLRKNR